jgi:lysine 6-dehydrogenase
VNVIILGAGLVGGPMAIDLAKDHNFRVTAVDANPQVLEKLKAHSIETIKSDLSKTENVTRLISDFDVVVNAVPGFMGFSTLKTIIEAKKDVVDIAFYSEDPFELDELARNRNVTAIVDCGVCPGMSNLIIGHLDGSMDLDSVLLYVGGLSEERKLPFEYKAGFSPLDVLEEYVRPARMIENFRMVSKPALSEPELINFPPIGTLEAFNSDGIRSLIRTVKAGHIQEKTLRYPGHIEKIALLRDIGFLDLKEIDVKGQKIRPRDLTARLLFPMWEMKNDDPDLTVAKFILKGKQDGKNLEYTYDLLDRYDPETRTSSMARTTGYTATAAVRMLEQKLFDRKGICPPEYIGKHQECYDFIMERLRERNIVYHESVREI